MPSESRQAEVTIEIAASLDEVWAALTEADQLTRWFPLEASVRPGVGGETRWSWDDAWTWVSEIDRWEPGVALRLLNREQRPFDTDGRELPAGQVSAATLAMEFTLATRAGKTILTLVHSGFGRGAAWDDEFDGVSVGWQFELRSLQHYLERHRGRRRRAGLARVAAPVSQAEAWRRLLGPGGFSIAPWPVAEASPCRVDAPYGEWYSGPVMIRIDEREFACIAAELGAGVFRIGTHQAGGRCGISVWQASYSADQAFIDELTGRAQTTIDRLFATS